MEVLNFMVCSEELAKFNYILVNDIPENIKKLKEIGCTDDKIKSTRDSNGTLDIYATLFKKGYTDSPQRGFEKSKAKIRQIEYDREIRLRELSLQEKQNEQKRRARKTLTTLWAIASVIIVVLAICLELFGNIGHFSSVDAALFLGVPIILGGGTFIFKTLPEKDNEQKAIAYGAVRLPKSVFPYDEKSYATVAGALCSAGFTNVKSVSIHDVTLGLLQKPSMVESITVDGEYVTSGGKLYRANAPVVITYHGK